VLKLTIEMHLNYHHLRYFWVVANEGSMSRAARRLNVSPSSLSVQIKALEERLGQLLFERRGKSLQLTVAGRIALDHADTVFRSGDELIETLSGMGGDRQILRVGAVATLSRNFQVGLLRPLIGRGDIEVIIHSGAFAELLAQLESHKLDIVLANQPAPPNAETAHLNTLLAEQPMSLVSQPDRHEGLRYPTGLEGAPLALPTRSSAVRAAFDGLMAVHGVRPVVIAEADDMAMLRLIAREIAGLTLVPPVVVRDELSSGVLVERCQIPGLHEQFYAITQQRRFPSPVIAEILDMKALGKRLATTDV